MAAASPIPVIFIVLIVLAASSYAVLFLFAFGNTNDSDIVINNPKTTDEQHTTATAAQVRSARRYQSKGFFMLLMRPFKWVLRHRVKIFVIIGGGVCVIGVVVAMWTRFHPVVVTRIRGNQMTVIDTVDELMSSSPPESEPLSSGYDMYFASHDNNAEQFDIELLTKYAQKYGELPWYIDSEDDGDYEHDDHNHTTTSRRDTTGARDDSTTESASSCCCCCRCAPPVVVVMGDNIR